MISNKELILTKEDYQDLENKLNNDELSPDELSAIDYLINEMETIAEKLEDYRNEYKKNPWKIKEHREDAIAYITSAPLVCLSITNITQTFKNIVGKVGNQLSKALKNFLSKVSSFLSLFGKHLNVREWSISLSGPTLTGLSVSITIVFIP